MPTTNRHNLLNNRQPYPQKAYKELLSSKRRQLAARRGRYEVGLAKLLAGEVDVGRMQRELTDLQPKLVETGGFSLCLWVFPSLIALDCNFNSHHRAGASIIAPHRQAGCADAGDCRPGDKGGRGKARGAFC